MAAVNYKIIKNFFTKEELNILQKYCYNKLDDNKDYTIDPQSFSPAWYKDPLMNALLDTKLPLVEKESNLKLFPTYAYWRYYIYGASLKKHVDRKSCEISATACIKKYDNWPLNIEDKTIELKAGMSVFIPQYVKHVIYNPHDEPLEGIVVLFGDNIDYARGYSFMDFLEQQHDFYKSYDSSISKTTDK